MHLPGLQLAPVQMKNLLIAEGNRGNIAVLLAVRKVFANNTERNWQEKKSCNQA